MKRIGMFRGMKLCADYKKMDAAQREALRAGRLHEMVAWARANSPYYAKLYERLPEQITLHDLRRGVYPSKGPGGAWLVP